MLVGTRLKASVGFYSVVIAKQAGIGPIRRQKSGGRTGAWFAGLQQLSARGPMSSSDELRLGEPGWGARLEKLVQEGKLSLEDAAKRVGQAAAAAGEHSNKRQKSSER